MKRAFFINMPERLTSKLQYRNFEPGEFCDEKTRTIDESISAIRDFPWEEQRKNLQVSLTNPSVCFQTDDEVYLKLALYYNGKFVLYFFDGAHLYTHSFIHVEDAYPFIRYFFEHGDIDPSQYKKEPTWLKELKKHFVSKDFVYSVAGKSIWGLMDGWTKASVIGWPIYCLLLVVRFWGAQQSVFALAFVFIVILIPFTGVSILLAFNYYSCSKGRRIIMSRGADSFWIGDDYTFVEVKKADVEQVIVKKNKNSRCPWNNCTVTVIYFRDNRQIEVPSALVKGEDIIYKLPGIPSKIANTFVPFCKKDLSDWAHFY